MKPLIIVFLKWPEPGRVKTRLAQAVGEGEAVRIYRALVKKVGAILSTCQEAQIAICYAPACEGERIRPWISREVFAPRPIDFWWPQPETDLGGRQAWAVEQAFREGYERVALVGTDCIDLDRALLGETWDLLETSAWVFGPARDGGYYLGATRAGAPSPQEVFDGVRWSTPHTLADCLGNLEAKGGAAALLKSLDDVDTYESWISIQDRVAL